MILQNNYQETFSEIKVSGELSAVLEVFQALEAPAIGGHWYSFHRKPLLPFGSHDSLPSAEDRSRNLEPATLGPLGFNSPNIDQRHAGFFHVLWGLNAPYTGKHFALP